MLYFTANARDGISGASGASCNTCCCQTISMRPDETNLVQINYAPWSLPIGWVVPNMQFEFEAHSESCFDAAIDGQEPPVATFRDVTNAINTQAVVDLTTGVSPAVATHVYSKIPLAGPYHGSAALTAAGQLTYTPNNGFEGWDVVWYKVTDVNSRTSIRSVVFKVGNALGNAPQAFRSAAPYIDPSKIVVDKASQIVGFPLYMPLTARSCEWYRLLIKQPAQNCDGSLFHHFACFDIRPKDC